MTLLHVEEEIEVETIFGLKLGVQVNHNYFHLAQAIRERGREFLLLDMESLQEQLKHQKISFLVVCTTNVEENKVFEKKIKHQLKFFVNQEKLCLFHFTSFANTSGGISSPLLASSGELNQLKSNFYHTIHLPLKTKEAVSFLIEQMERLMEDLPRMRQLFREHQF